MFNSLPRDVAARMHELEAVDAEDREDGTPRANRLRQVPPDTGRFLALLAAMAPAGRWVEIGTSGGYSALWLSLPARERGHRLTTFEVLPEKFMLARETFRLASAEDVIDPVQGDARELLEPTPDIAFCFLDAEKEVYSDCYELVVPLLVPGGVLVADNAISHQADLQPVIDRALADERVDAMVVPIGKGELLCRRR
ncbi:MAG: class I SAM-dependent methyltransferase [Dehalococcoidia bacterium]|nr:class I SAM-dependent methyltransferase [Dehalococcoidia bacterium]